jgi:hypothetical protein
MPKQAKSKKKVVFYQVNGQVKAYTPDGAPEVKHHQGRVENDPKKQKAAEKRKEAKDNTKQ